MIAGQEMVDVGSWCLPDVLREFAAAGDGDFVAELIEEFQADTALRLQRLHDALTTGDSARVRAEVHAIKGGARQIGADAMGDLCEQIELLSVDAAAQSLVERVNRLDVMFAALCRDMCFGRD